MYSVYYTFINTIIWVTATIHIEPPTIIYFSLIILFQLGVISYQSQGLRMFLLISLPITCGPTCQ